MLADCLLPLLSLANTTTGTYHHWTHWTYCTHTHTHTYTRHPLPSGGHRYIKATSSTQSRSFSSPTLLLCHNPIPFTQHRRDNATRRSACHSALGRSGSGEGSLQVQPSKLSVLPEHRTSNIEHGPRLAPTVMLAGLRRDGILLCAGSQIHRPQTACLFYFLPPMSYHSPALHSSPCVHQWGQLRPHPAKLQLGWNQSAGWLPCPVSIRIRLTQYTLQLSIRKMQLSIRRPDPSGSSATTLPAHSYPSCQLSFLARR